MAYMLSVEEKAFGRCFTQYLDMYLRRHCGKSLRTGCEFVLEINLLTEQRRFALLYDRRLAASVIYDEKLHVYQPFDDLNALCAEMATHLMLTEFALQEPYISVSDMAVKAMVQNKRIVLL